jgi:tetratricopeptide (TPR) repeat protein
MSQIQKPKTINVRKNIVIDPAASMPIKKFMERYKAKDYAGAQLIEKEMTPKDLDRSNILFCRAVIRLHHGNIKLAQSLLEKILVTRPKHVGAIHNLGTICLDKMEYDKGEEYFRRSIELDPKNANAYNNLGACCSYQGKPEQAKEFYLKALELDPSRAQTFRNMCQHHKFETYDDVLITLLIAMSDEKLSDDDRSHLCFSAFKAFDDLGERKRAFDYLAKGNSLFRSVIKYTPKSDADNVTIVKRAFKPSQPKLREKFIKNNPLPHIPIFVIGMPRSGTSLTEQVLSAHSQVHGGGELPILNQIANPMLGRIYGKITDANLEATHFEQFRKRYINACKDYPHDGIYLTDKMPANFRWVGFIKQALPEAKIINQIRDPRAICWSIFKLRFSTVGNGYAYNQVDLGNYYHRYKDLMAYWEKKYPDYIHNLNYEFFTENQLEETKRLLNFVGLPWEDACVNFHESNRPVKTASSAQVKKELYTGSSQAWRKYEEFLEPLLTALGPID